MNEFTTEAFSIICRNEDIFEFTQEHGLHGVALCNIENPDENWFNPRLIHSLGYNDGGALSWEKIISPENYKKLQELLVTANYARDILSGEIDFLHAKGFSIPMIYKALHRGQNLVIALKKVYDYSHIEYNPERDFQREQLLETILETIEVGVVAFDSEGKIIVFNRAAKKWHGVPLKNVNFEEIFQYFNLYQPDGITPMIYEDLPILKILQGNQNKIKSSLVVKPKTGKKRIIKVQGSRLLDEQGNLSGAVIAMQDVTGKNKTEEKLRISEETFRGSFKSAADGMAITDATGTCIEVNDRLCEIMGYTSSELKTLNFQEVTYPEDLEEDLKLWAELLKGERDFYQMEKRAIHKSGKIKHIIVSVAIVRDENNDPFHFITQIIDISSLKEAENQLTVSEEMFRGTFENAFNGMAISDLKGKFLKLNDSLCKMVGYSQEELMHLNFIDITHPDDVHEDLKAMQEMLNSERDYLHNEKRFINKNGEHIHVILSVSMVRDHNSNPIYFIAQMTDITELKMAQKEIGRVLNVTREQNNRLNNFAHIVSHNLRSHSGNLEMLLEIYIEEHPDAKENEIIQMALQASGKLKETIQDLNEMAFLDLAVTQNVIPVNLRKSVTDTLGAINALVKKVNLKVYHDIPADLEVLSLPAYIESIILNFSTNAIKYRSLNRTPILRFGAMKKKDYIELTIEDNGVGIDLEKYGDNLFGMYKTFHQNEDAKGIGLFISKNQIEAVGGKIEVESEVDKGTVFTIFFKYEKN